MPSQETDIDPIVASVLASPKYRAIARGLVERIARQEASSGRDVKETAKAVKNKLHQVAGAYLQRTPDYAIWLSELRQAAASPDPEDLQAACRRMLRLHASTRERLPILDEFYARLLSDLPPIHSVLDLACGLNPLAIPWMGLPPQAEYNAVDIYGDMMGFLDDALRIFGVQGMARAMDVVESTPDQEVDLAFLLKTIPCLEQVDKSAGRRLLESLRARTLLVSFPAHSLGGRSKGMPGHYASHFEELVAGKPWGIRRFEFRSELVFRIEK
jgi:16S rRNA (guanine(1405)-N(7))-methyltransferase